MPRTVKIQASFQVVNASGVVSPNETIKELDLQVAQVSGGVPLILPGNTIDYAVNFGTITNARRVFLRTDYPVTLKIKNPGDIGFSWEGAGILPLGAGVDAMWISTGPNQTTIDVVVCGD